MDFYTKAGAVPIGNMRRTHFTSEISSDTVGDKVTLMGWVHILRDKGKLKFLILRDERGMCQIFIHQKRVSEDVFETAEQLKPEFAVSVDGEVVEAKQVAAGAEVVPTSIRILNTSDRLPIDVVEGKVDIDLDTRLNHRILDLRKPTINAIFRVQHALVRFSREYLEKKEFVEIHTPKIVAEATEGGANLFEIKYFDKLAYLAQSPQFYKQLMLLAGFGRVFEIAPVFRAEKHNTRRHINEYTSFDFEMSWISGVEDVMQMEENMLHYAFLKTKENLGHALETLGINLEVPEVPFKRIKYAEAIDLVNAEGKDLSITDDLDPECEQILGEIFPEKFGTDMVFITHYPLELRPAYTMPSLTDEGMTESFDLTYHGMEITTGGQRIHLYDLLVERFKAKGYNIDNFGFYLDPFKYGAPPHGGLGLGIERLTMQLLGIDNIREATLLPRDRDRITP
ncbi:MAG: Aspartate--tRNA(Asp/Asn) ligase [Candidatus Thorarchaeota archaeon]|nr:MAG: Aspartate--tRNA(Asp/Asn) ligase [Candidatus Thorarchaeota archaeon]